ncbi:Tyrosine-protein phosphatase DSP1, partial [Lachnellula suecica]
ALVAASFDRRFDQVPYLDSDPTGYDRGLSCADVRSVCGYTAGGGTELNEAKMTEGNLVSKRTTRVFAEDHHIEDTCTAAIMTSESKRHSRSPEREMEERRTWSSASSIDQRDHRELLADIGLGSNETYGVEDLGEKATKKPKKSKSPKGEDEDDKDDEKVFNFGEVIPGSIYRGSFPHTQDYQFLQTLGLKTIVSLVNKDFPDEFKAFMKANDISHKIIDMPGTKKVAISEAVMHSIMDVVLDKQNYPLLIHCNHGKHRTGCTVAVVRHLHGFEVAEIEREYRKFAGEKARECDLKYITEYQVSSLRHFLVVKDEELQALRSSRRSNKMARFIFIAAVSLGIWTATLIFLPAYNALWIQV